MLKFGFFSFIILAVYFPFCISRKGSQLEHFWRIYSEWASTHSEYECSIIPEMETVLRRFRLWQIKQESGRVDGVLEMMVDFPISHDSYLYLDSCGRKLIYFPEINRTALFCLNKTPDSDLEGNSFVVSPLLGNLELAKRFLVFEELSETDEGIVFDMTVDIKKMKAAGLVPERVEASEVRLIFSLKKSGELVRMSRQFDDGYLEVLYFDYISFSSDDVRESFPKIENRSSHSIIPSLTYTAALEEIRRERQLPDVLRRK